MNPMPVLAETGSENLATTPDAVIYVDGIGSGAKNGSDADNAFATLTDAYNAIPENNTLAVIVVCGNVSVVDGCDDPAGDGSYYFLPKHSGEVILTSVWGESEDYKANAGLDFGGKKFYFFGDTSFRDICITGKANYLYANYFTMHFGIGIEIEESATDSVADYLYMGTTSKVGKNTEMKDVSLTIDSGVFGTVYGGGASYQGSVTRGKDNSIDITVNGGKITNVLYGSGHGNTDNAHHKSICITVNGGELASIYGAHGDATVYEDIQIILNAGTVKAARGAHKYTAGNNANTSYTPTLYGNVEITVAGATVTTLAAAYDDSTIVKGDKILTYKGQSGVSLPNAVRFNVLSLQNSSLTIKEARKEIWQGIAKVMLTDDSTLTLAYTPTDTTLKKVTVSKAGTEWQTTNPLITAPANTPELFELGAPLGYVLEYNGAAASWTLKKSELNIGSQGIPGTAMDLDLGLGDGTYTPVPADADAYTTFLYKLNDLGEAKEEVNVINPVAIQGQVELYVSPNGEDTNNGSKDAPFKTIARALELIQPLQKLGVQGIVIYLREGIYVTSESIMLNQLHSGTNDIPVIVSAYNNEEVVISGGVDIAGNAFTAVTDEAILGRLKEGVKDKIVAVDLSTQGISSVAPIVGGVQGGPTCQIFIDGQELTISRYPNVNNLPLGEVLDIGPVTVTNSDFPYNPNSSDGVEYKMQDLRPTTWVNDGNIWLKGSLYAEWDITNIRVAEIRTEEGTIKLDGGARYGARSLPSNTYYYYNVLEEMDVPGEYYLDPAKGILYLYPTGDMSNATVTYSAMAEDIIVMNGTENVVLNGLTIENGAGRGVYMTDCSRSVIQNCKIRQVGTGVVVNGCSESGVIYSDIEMIANRPVEITPGQTIFDYTPSHNFVQNCYIHSTGTKNEKYSAIYMQGTGNVVSHNLIQGTFSVSIYLYIAKECIVEYNEIVGGPTGTSDCGAIYFGYTPNDSGCHIRYNYIHDIGLFSDSNAPNGIYFDEGNSGNFAYGNVMRNVPCGFFTNSGSENVIVNNIVMDGRTGTVNAISGCSIFDNYTTSARIARAGAIETVWNTWQSMSDVQKAALKERYPLQDALYQRIAADMAANNGAGTGLFVSHDNYAANNLIYDCSGIGFAGGTHTVKDNTFMESDPFVNAVNHDYTLKEDVAWDVDENVPLIHMQKVGVSRTIQGVDAFSMYAPFNGNTGVDPKSVLLKWTIAGGADTYEVVIATNEALTEHVVTITTEEPYCYFEDFAFGQTYYWKVTAKTTAKTRISNEVHANDGAVYSFKTMTEEEYKELNQADFADLEELLAQAKALFAQMKEAFEGGLYEDGSKAALNTAITTAEAVVNSNLLQEEVELAERELRAAIELAKLRRQEQYVTFEELNAEDWSDPAGMKGVANVVGDELQFTFSTSNSLRSEMAYAKPIGVRDILQFQFKLDELKAWNGFAIAQSNTNAVITAAAATNGYFICIKPDQIELQKRNNGKSYGNIAVYANKLVDENGAEVPLMTGNTWYDITIAALNETDGSVRILFKVGDTVVFDYLDEEEAITGSEGFGVVIPTKDNGTVYLKKADTSANPDIYAASIGGVNYTTLEAAVNAANTGATVKLEADATLPSSNYDKAITYDLNGHTLTGNTFTGIIATVADSSNGEGLLKVPQNGLALDSNNDGYMPVWDSTNNGYRFTNVTIEDRNVDNTGDALIFAMRPSFGSDAIGQLVAQGYKTGMVRVGVRIRWNDPETNTTKTQDLALDDSWLLKMYSDPSVPKGVKFTISGGETITNFTATTIVWSDLSTCPNVEIVGTTHTYQTR